MVLGCLANVVSYTDRSMLSLAIVPMSEEFTWFTPSVQGWVMSAFFFGYICTQVLGGVLSRSHGPKRIIIIAVFIWSVATLLLPIAAYSAFGLLFATRVVLGLGEGVLLPCLHDLAVVWVPPAERATAAAAITSGQFVGTAIANFAAPLVARWWPLCFYLFGGFGLLWCVAFGLLATSRPREHKCVSAAELSHIQGQGQGGGASTEGVELRTAGSDSSSTSSSDSPVYNEYGGGGSGSDGGGGAAARHRPPSSASCGSVPWRRFFTNRAALAIYCAHASHNWSWYLLLSWLPKFLTEQGADLEHAGFLAVLPQLVAFTLANLGGFVSDRVLLGRLRCTPTTTRRILGAFAHFGPSSACLVLASVPSPGAFLSTAMACIAIGFGALVQVAFWTNIMDVAPRHAGILLGISNTMATLPGILCNISTGHMLEPGGAGWPAVFALAAGIELAGGLVYVTCARAEPQF